ncbi:MAG: hypothetical protein ACOWWM_16280 [Desulfobacterales bacterium]
MSTTPKFTDLSPQGTVNSVAGLARILGVVRGTIYNWQKEPGFPIEPDGSFDPEQVMAWRHGDRAGHIVETGEVNEKTKWDIEFRRWRAKLSEVAYQRETGELIPRDQVESLLTDRATEFKKALLGRARRLSLRIAGKDAKECQRLLEVDSLQILEIYSRPNPLLKDDPNATNG